MSRCVLRSQRVSRAFWPLTAVVASVSLLVAACGGGHPGAPRTGAQSASASGSPSSNAALTPVRVAIGPYFEYQPWLIAHELGLDKAQGVDLQVKVIASTQTAVLAVKRGDMDLAASCHACDFPLVKSVPDLRDFMITNQFKGFILIGRKGKTSTFAELAKKEGEARAKADILRSLRGKTFTIHKVAYGALMAAALSQVGLELSDIKIVDFPDDASAALAFTRGTGDYYIGSLPQEAKLLQSGDYVNVGGTEILGDAGLWYSTMVSTQSWLESHADLVNKLLAIWYRTMKYLRDDPDRTMPLFTDAINQAAASNLPESSVRYIVTRLDFFPTLDEAQKLVYNESSKIYFWKSVEYYTKENRNVLPPNFNPRSVVVDAEYFARFLQQSALVAWVNSPLRAGA